jgi:hypothetical protein
MFYETGWGEDKSESKIKVIKAGNRQIMDLVLRIT